MAALIDWYEAAGDMYPVERAAELHTRFAKIHPFIDGLDRDGRRIRKRAADRSRSRGDIREP
ncbi:hypothetical protein WJ40_06105 [Burkholderia cepacia]|nr:hypothetical protein WJ40_06105 [Burkholderia cepacia]